MERDSSASQPRRYFRFSLGMMLIFVTCVCCFLAGNMRGSRIATASMWNRLSVTTLTYYADDLAANSKSGALVIDYAGLISTIKQRCSPEFWDDAGGPGTITTSPANNSLNIAADQFVHQQIADLVSQLRKEKFGPDYHYTWPGAPKTDPSAYTKTYYVDDFAIEGELEVAGTKIDFNGLMAKIVENCSPDQWQESGGTRRISPFPLNSSLIISADVPGHKEIADFLTKLRKEKFGPDYQYTPGVAAQAASVK